MNAKKVKALRASLRSEGVDPTEVNYGKTRNGSVVLDPSCGRFAYKRVKRVARQFGA